MTTLFISDLHLDAERPAGITQFLDFMESEASQATALYILGDLFETWIGDDDTNPGHAPIVAALATLKLQSVPCFFMHGNRDFLIGRRFATATGCILLAEYEVLVIEGEKVLLTHGDLLCTDDKPYMALRAEVRDPRWQREFLAKPIQKRRAIADDLREKSQAATAAKTEEIMDVNQGAVEAAMRRHDVSILLHGHTHRPDVHRFSLDGAAATRIVLGAWHEQGSVVRWDENGFVLESLQR
ncbi:MAG: UDP-2,3-diacylglucosamine diphosphatase [Gammaproteobacteria bacterium]|nr:MAG: UDP-2,3-diacylglucosamine diphosphatase [Gammaproteobacteria bacterium]